ncbi:MAG: DUF2065 family protein [Methyloceanibacter sp.]
MTDLAVAIGLVLVLEGLLWALAPGFGRRLLQASAHMSEQSLRLGGTIAVAAGVLVVWLAKG